MFFALLQLQRGHKMPFAARHAALRVGFLLPDRRPYPSRKQGRIG
jgi:hypothetical protein